MPDSHRVTYPVGDRFFACTVSVAFFCPEGTHAFFQRKSIHLNQFILVLYFISQSPFTRFGFTVTGWFSILIAISLVFIPRLIKTALSIPGISTDCAECSSPSGTAGFHYDYIKCRKP